MDYRKTFCFRNVVLYACLILTSDWHIQSGSAEVQVTFLGCYEENLGDPSFYILPSDVDETTTKIEECVEKCTILSTMMEITAAGIQSGTTCLCSADTSKATKLDKDDACNKKCVNTKYSDQTCGSESDPVKTSVYEVISAFGQLEITKFTQASKEPGVSDFTVEPKDKKGVIHILDYGDDSPSMTVKDGNIPSHAYPLSGIYEAAIIATRADGIGTLDAVSTQTFSVDQAMVDNSLDLSDCPNVTIAETSFNCNVKIFSGTNSLLGILFIKKLLPTDVDNLKEKLKDETNEDKLKDGIDGDLKTHDLVSIFTVVDVGSVATGPGIPQSPDLIQTSPLGDGSFVMPETMITESGYITAVEMYGVKDGDIQIWVLKPQTVGNSSHCYYQDACDDLTFYPYCTWDLRRSDKYDKRTQIEGITKVNVGYKVYPLKREEFVQVFAGDILAFTAAGGTLAYRDVTRDEIPDRKIAELSDKDNRRKRETSDDNKRHFVRAIVTSPIEVPVTHTFQNPGEYTMLGALLSISPEYPNLKIYDQRDIDCGIPLDEFKINLKKEFYKTKEEVDFEGNFKKGSDATVVWNFGDGKTEESKCPGILGAKPIYIKHTYDEDGNYTVTAEAKNVNNEFKCNELTVYVFSTIKENDWEVTGEPAVLSPPGVINFTVEYKGSAKRPHGVSVEIIWSDDQEKEVFRIEDSSSDKTFLFNHTYPPGNYTAKVRLVNPVSEVNKLEQKLEIIEEIKDGEPSVLFSENKDSPNFRKGYGDNGTTFPKDVFINITIKPNKGQVEKYKVQWENGTLISESQEAPNIQMKLTEEGNFTIHIYQINKLQTKGPIVISWESTELLRDINVEDHEMVTDLNEEHIYEVDVAGNDLCLQVDYGDGNIETYGEEALCKKYFPDTTYNSTELGHPHKLTHVYANRGYYDFVATAVGDMNNITKKLSITVNKSSFKRHGVAFRVKALDYKNPIRTTKSTGYRIETQADLEETMAITNVTVKWVLTPIDPATGLETHPDLNLVNDTFGASWNKSFLFIKPRIVNYGLYKASYHFLVTSTEMDPLFPVNSTCFSYYEIYKTELAAVIVEEDLYRIMRGYGQIIMLEPDKFSSDLDQDSKEEKGLTIKWFCSRTSWREKIDSYEINETQEISPPTGSHTDRDDKGGCFGNGPAAHHFEGSRLKGTSNPFTWYDYYPPTSYCSQFAKKANHCSQFAKKDINNSSERVVIIAPGKRVRHPLQPAAFKVTLRCKQNVGQPVDDASVGFAVCYKESGASRVKVGDNNDDKTWVLDAKSLYKPDEIYRVEIEIAKDDRKSNASLLIVLHDEPAPVLKIRCLNRRLCAMTTDGTFINPTIRLAVIGECVEFCPTSNYTYKWKVSGTNDEDSLNTTELDVEPYIIGQGENMMALSVDFFKNENNSQFKVLSLSMEIIEDEKVEGQVTTRLIVNLPPVNGTCKIDVMGSTALVDEYGVICKDWVDPDEHEITNYKIFLIDERGYSSTLVSSLDNQFKIILRPGLLDLWSEVSDIHGASTKEMFSEKLKVNPPSYSEHQQFLNSKLNRLKLSGNQFQLMQALQALQVIEFNYPNLDGAPDSPEPGSEEARKADVKKSENINTYLGFLKDCNLNSVDDIDFVSNTAGTVIGKGDYLDRTGKDMALNMAGELTDMLLSDDFETVAMITPVQSKSFLTNTVSIVGAVAGTITKTILEDRILPSDMEHVNEIEYDTSVKQDPDFAVPDTLEGMQQRSIKDDAIAQSIIQYEKISSIVQNINELVLENLIPREPPLHLITISEVDMSIIRTKPDAAAGIDYPVGGASFKLPDYCQLTNQGPNCTDTAPFSLSVVTWNGPTNPASKNIDVLSAKTKIVQMDVFTGNLNLNTPLAVNNASQDIEIVIPRHPGELPNVTIVEPKMKWFEYMVYHQVEVPKHDSSINLEFAIDSGANYALFMRYGKKPVVHLFDKIWIVTPDDMMDGTYKQFLTSKDINNQTGYFYFGVTELHDQENGKAAFQNLTKEMVNKNFTTSYTMRLFTSGCLYYDDFLRLWVSHGCRVETTTENSTVCKCTHLTSFGSGFFVAPTPIDFSYVFANASFADNLTIYVTIIVTFGLFIIFLIWARCKDRKDKEKLGALPLPDNNNNEKYMYEILVFTGNAKGATTNSKVNFILSGDKDETEIRTFGTPPRKVFRRDGVDVFVMSVPRPLGQLQFVRIWHENNGKGNFASWYLNYIMFRDVQTGEKFEFVCNNWLAVEKGDGQIDRVLPVADKAQLTEFSHLFQTTSRKKLTDGHLWFSVFLRPPRSRFTRCQRVASCMSLLYLSMLVNAMWYGTVPENSNSGMKFGPVHLSPEQISVGFMSNIIVFPPSFFIIFLFRKARPRNLRPSRIDQALEIQRNKSGQSTQNKGRAPSAKDSNTKDNKLKYNRTKKFTLPWWCAIIAWILCFVCMGASIFFLWAYGITFGNAKTKSWLTSLIVSFFSSILITQPIKVLLLAMIFSAICKKVETDEDDADEDELDPNLEFDEEWMTNDPTKPRKVAYKKMEDSEETEKARSIRRKEVKTWGILTEIFAYLIFLWILSIIGYGNNDPNAFWMVRTLKKGLLKEGKLDGYMNIKDPDGFWRWTNNVLMYNLFAQRDYINMPPYGMAGFLNDKVNRLMGYAIMRQIRLRPGECKKPPMVETITKCSGTTTEISREDHNDYDVGWNVLLKNSTRILAEYEVVERAFRYMSQEDLDGFPFVGDLDVYSGGGYVFELKGRAEELRVKLADLQKSHWIDHLTRAVMIDFSVYNAQVNLFGVVSLYSEFIPGGGIVPEWSIDAVRLIEYAGTSWQFIALCQAVFVLFIIYYTYRELRQMCKMGRSYFGHLGNYAELALIVFSIIAMVVFVIRYVAAQKITDVFEKTKGSQYINLHRCQVLSSVLNCVMALIVFVSGVKFIKLLRFNKRLRMLSQTILRCAIDLKGFALVFLIICVAFGQVFFLYFQPYLKDYSNPILTTEALFAVLLNVFVFDDYRSGSTSHGPFIFISFSLVTSIILINLFLTIILQTFEQVKLDLADQPNEYEVADYVIQKIKGIFGFGKKKPQPKIQNPEAKAAELEQNHPTNKFPEKVDQLVEYINVVYFDGKLDLNSKEALRHGRRRLNFNPRNADYLNDRPHVYNSN